MKREHEGDNDDRQGHRNKRPKGDGFSEALANGKFELRMLVSSKSAGAIIGKGGENIKRLRTSFDAQVQVPDSNSPERIATIVADPNTVIRIVEDIAGRLEDPPSERDNCEIRLLVHQSHAGALIGRSGSKIKELRDKCNARLKIFGVCCPNSTDRVLVTSGDMINCLKIVQCVVDELRELPVKGNYTPYLPVNHDPSSVADYGGYSGAGAVGANTSGGARSINNNMGGGGRGGRPPGMPGQWNAGGDSNRRSGGRDFGGAPQFASFAPNAYGAPPPYGAPPGPDYGYQFQQAQQPQQQPQITTAQVTIPSDLGGTIIGRGGERIARIRQESGAQITLDPSNGQSERIITITGTNHQIHAAQYMLQQCVRNSQAGRQRFGETEGAR